MDNVRIKFTQNGAYEIRSSPGVAAFLESHGAKIRDKANATLPKGGGYKMSSRQGRRNPSGRWAVRVYTASRAAKRSNAINNTLHRLLGSS